MLKARRFHARSWDVKSHVVKYFTHLLNPKFPYPVYERSPLLPIPRQETPVHILTPCFLKIYFPSTHCIGGWFWGLRIRENIFPFRESNPGHPVRIPSLYRRSCPGSLQGKCNYSNMHDKWIQKHVLAKRTPNARNKNNKGVGGGEILLIFSFPLLPGLRVCSELHTNRAM
jgi:hypothetical protein